MLKQEFEFDKETLRVQRVARNSMRRKMNILLLIFAASIVLLLVLNRIYPSVSSFIIILFLPLLLGSNWIQWNTLISHGLKCPHCGEFLAKRVNLLFSPSPKCRHCGEIALASIRQLVQDKTSEELEK